MTDINPNELFQKIQSLLQSHGVEITVNPAFGFNITMPNEPKTCKAKFLLIPIYENSCFSKALRQPQKEIHAVALFSDFNYQDICFKKEDLSLSKFKEFLLTSITSFGFMPDEQYKKLYDIFAQIAQEGLESRVRYSESGLTPDNKYFLYKNEYVEMGSTANFSDHEIKISAQALGMMLNCCKREKAIALLLIQLIGLVYEFTKQLPNDKMRICCVTVLPYIYGESGCGKTTIAKALYEYSYDNRYLSLATSTEAAIQNKLASVFSGVVIIDDVPHSTVNKCSMKALDKLESILRTYGDIGAEKCTAQGQLTSTSAWAVITAEALFVTVQSSVLRLLPIQLNQGDINFEAVEVLNENRAKLDSLMSCYLKWYIGKLQFETNESKIADIPDLTCRYKAAHDEILKEYPHIREARIIDSHAQAIMYFDFFIDFFKFIKIDENEILALRDGLKHTLRDSAETQCLNIYESSLSFYLNQALQNIIDSDSMGNYSIVGKITNVQTGGDNVLAYKCGSILMFTTAQKKNFFSQIRNLIPNGKSVQDKQIIQSLISMKIYLDAKTDKCLDYPEKDNRIWVNGKETRVMKLKITKED